MFSAANALTCCAWCAMFVWEHTCSHQQWLLQDSGKVHSLPTGMIIIMASSLRQCFLQIESTIPSSIRHFFSHRTHIYSFVGTELVKSSGVFRIWRRGAVEGFCVRMKFLPRPLVTVLRVLCCVHCLTESWQNPDRRVHCRFQCSGIKTEIGKPLHPC